MNILLLTTIYPAPDLKRGTSVCHYFASQWAMMGHNVKVIHFKAVFPEVFYLAARLAPNMVASRTGAVFTTKRQRVPIGYDMDGVSVTRIPVFKYIPHGRFARRSLDRALDIILRSNEADGFVPDAITGHFHNPQLELVSRLGKVYKSARKCMVMHDGGDSIRKTYPDSYGELMEDIDVWGFRSDVIKRTFERNFGNSRQGFLCYSGIPEDYLANNNRHEFKGNLRNFIYIGELIERKYPQALIKALQRVYPEKGYHITYIGAGYEMKNLRDIVGKLGVEECVTFTGKIDRNEIPSYLDRADCMIMISRSEAFGLVYLEAMARGCIVVASRNEGMDGIIIDGENGFLCSAGDYRELAEVIKRINGLSDTEKSRISRKAVATVSELTDFKVACHYLAAITRH